MQTSAAAGLAMGLRPAVAQAQGPALVENGVSRYRIVLPAAASESQQYAAAELQRYLIEMTGAELPIVSDEIELPSQAILLGQTRHTGPLAGALLGEPPLGDDGFAILVNGDHLLLVGSEVRGTLYAVYELLEKYGGVRWYASFHSVVPRRQTWRLPASLIDVQRPAFAMREPFWYDMFEGDFAARVKANGNRPSLTERHGGKVRFGAGMFVHTFNRLLPPEEFFASHPEYYSEIEGKRTTTRSQLCLTNPDVVRIVTERTLAAIRQDPTAKLFSVSQNDWYGYCTCPACRAVDEREGSPSGTMIQFVNQVAEAVEREFPEVWIETLAYQYTRTPPRTLRPRPNVVPRLCTIECDFSQGLTTSPFEQNRRFLEDIRGWAAISDKLYIWDYVTNFRGYLAPHPNFAALQPNIQLFRDSGVVGVFEQGAYQGRHAEFAELRAWVLAKLLWDPDADLAALYDDFFAGYYGVAAGPIRQYWSELQQLSAPDDQVLRCFNSMRHAMFTDEFFARAEALWGEAERLAEGDPALLQRVRLGGMTVLYSQLERWPAFAVGTRLSGDRLETTGVPEGFASRAQQLLDRVALSGSVRISENAQTHDTFLARLRGAVTGYPLVQVTVGGATAGLVAEHGGRPVVWRAGDDHNWLAAEAGGIDWRPEASVLGAVSHATWRDAKVADGAITVRLGVAHRHQITRTVRPSGQRLEVEHLLADASGHEQAVAPAGLVAIDLGAVHGLAVRQAGGDWQAVPLAAGESFTHWAVDGDAAGQPIEIASGVTGRQVRLSHEGGPLDRVLLRASSASGAVEVYCREAAASLPAGGSRTSRLVLEASEGVSGLPTAGAQALPHDPAVVVIEDAFIGLGRPGEWGAPAADAEAADGHALKLFNSHYEWCVQYQIDPRLFTPGARYRAEARVRVASRADGLAFWGGVYDVARARGVGQVEPKTGEVEPGYQWYSLATWAPEGGQYVWIGPGRFDKATGQSAVEAVWLDQLRFVRVDAD